MPMYIDKAGGVTLVDILQKNIEICQERFKEYSQIKYYCNNGTDLKDLADNTYTALFTYDAMVHFFAYMAYRAGFKIVSQDLIDWAMPEGDCLTLVEKI